MRKSTLLQEMKEDPFMTPREVADYFRVDIRTVARYCKDGKFGDAPSVIRLPGPRGDRRIRTSAVRRAQQEGKFFDGENG